LRIAGKHGEVAIPSLPAMFLPEYKSQTQDSEFVLKLHLPYSPISQTPTSIAILHQSLC